MPLVTSLSTKSSPFKVLLCQGSVGEWEQDLAAQGDCSAPYHHPFQSQAQDILSPQPSSNPKSPSLSQTKQLYPLWDQGWFQKQKPVDFFYFSFLRRMKPWSPEQKALSYSFGMASVEDRNSSFFHKEQKWLTPQKIRQVNSSSRLACQTLKHCLSHTLFPEYGASPGRGSRPYCR